MVDASTTSQKGKVSHKEKDIGGTSLQEPSDGSPSKLENHVPLSPNENKKRKRMEVNDLEVVAKMSFPGGTELSMMAGLKFLEEDVGQALQFLEFSSTFKEVLDLKAGELEYILQELLRAGNGCRRKHYLVIRFHIVLLLLIQEDFKNVSPELTYKRGKNSWLHALRNCASRSKNLWEKLKFDNFNFEAEEYESLAISARLRLLNFLCDEALCTVKLRLWIIDQKFRFAENVKVSKKRVQAAKAKGKQLKLKMKDDVVKAITANEVRVSTSEHEAVVSEIETQVAQAHVAVLEAKSMVPYGKSCDAVRTEPLISDIKVRNYWKLKGCSDESAPFLQDVGNLDGAVCSEKWFTLDAEQLKGVEDLICFKGKGRRQPSS